MIPVVADETPNPFREWITVIVPHEVVEECKRRGVTPEAFVERMCVLAAQAERDAAELFDDWTTRPAADQMKFVREAVLARLDLEFPKGTS